MRSVHSNPGHLTPRNAPGPPRFSAALCSSPGARTVAAAALFQGTLLCPCMKTLAPRLLRGRADAGRLLPQVGPVSKSYTARTHVTWLCTLPPLLTHTVRLAERGSLERWLRAHGKRRVGGQRRADRKQEGAAGADEQAVGLERHLLAAWWFLLIKEWQHPGHT